MTLRYLRWKHSHTQCIELCFDCIPRYEVNLTTWNRIERGRGGWLHLCLRCVNLRVFIFGDLIQAKSDLHQQRFSKSDSTSAPLSSNSSLATRTYPDDLGWILVPVWFQSQVRKISLSSLFPRRRHRKFSRRLGI